MYNTSQQRMRYLVEFCLPGDEVPEPPSQEGVEEREEEEEEEETSEAVEGLILYNSNFTCVQTSIRCVWHNEYERVLYKLFFVYMYCITCAL